MEFLVEETKEGQKAYPTLLTDNPQAIAVLNNKLVQQILQELGKEPACPMDIARRLKQHEQKIYYHIRNLEKFGLIKLERLEERVGATAKIYSLVSPVIAYKLFDDGSIVDKKTRAAEIKFLRPFAEKGKLNSIIVVGSPDPHGKYKCAASDGYCGINLAMFLGEYVDDVKIPFYKLDTQTTKEDMKKNMILIGGPKSNIITEKINKLLPIYFDYSEEFRDWNIVSSLTKTIYREKFVGIIVRFSNPFEEGKEILLLAGKGFTGSRAAVLGLTKYPKEILKGNSVDSSVIAKVVRGIDVDSDGIIDDVEFCE
ncbi:MAG: helix-turn-helix domain-containing protein [Candidatus Aenigmarchaeota archaeon]|nr:helix-turn-helix domain-containing protein [Candidatus Aenigmarchaeota archaeon]